MARTLVGFALLCACQGVGEGLVAHLGLPLPGPVVGMVLLLALLAALGTVPEGIGRAAALLLDHLPLFFVPVAVGALAQPQLWQGTGPRLALAVAASTLGAVAVTGLAVNRGRRDGPAP